MELRLHLTGTRPTMMHNGQLANPFNPIVRQLKVLNSKKQKTEDDLWEIARLEWTGGLYYATDIGPYWPARNILACLGTAARKKRKGLLVQTGVILLNARNPLGYDGPRDLDGMWADEKFRDQQMVVVQKSRILRTRPIFEEGWELLVPVEIDTTVIDPPVFEEIVHDAGRLVGLSEWPRVNGLFEAKILGTK